MLLNEENQMITIEFTEPSLEINTRDAQSSDRVSLTEGLEFYAEESTQEWVKVMDFIQDFLATHRDTFEELARR